MPMNVVVLTVFPDIFPGPLGASLLGKALQNNIWSLRAVSLKDYGIGRHKTIDDTGYSGGPGMVIRPDVVNAAMEDITQGTDNPTCIYMTPRGHVLTQKDIVHYAHTTDTMIILCGRYEGVDQRVLDKWHFQEVSLGDFILCSGDIPAMALIEACIRTLPGVLGNEQSVHQESFNHGLLEHPLYTKPRLWDNRAVPDVLLSGHHQHVQQWKHDQSKQHTKKIRPDLWSAYIKNTSSGTPHS